MKSLLEYKRALSLLGSAMMATSGACWGYIYASKELEEKYNAELETLLAKESKKIQSYYDTRYKTTGPEAFSQLEGTPVIDHDFDADQHIVIPKAALATVEGRSQVMAQLAEAIEPSLPNGPDEEEVSTYVPEPIGAVQEDISFEALMEERSGEKPYIISKEEFLRNDGNCTEQNLAFFEGDGILLDDTDEIIPDTDLVVGDANLRRFGVMSEDNNVVYVQNDRSEQIFRIVRNFGTATEALYGPEAGEEATIQHSSMKRRSRREER